MRYLSREVTYVWPSQLGKACDDLATAMPGARLVGAVPSLTTSDGTRTAITIWEYEEATTHDLINAVATENPSGGRPQDREGSRQT